MDKPLTLTPRGWILGSCFQYPYHCHAPLTKEQFEFTEKYLVPAVRGIVADIERVNTPELRRQYKESVLSRLPSTFDWFI